MSLTISGTQVLKDAKALILRGMQSSSNANIQLNDSPTQWWSLTDIQFMKAHGGNFFEVNEIPLSLYLNTDGSVNQTQFTKTIDKWAQWAKDEQMYLLITFCSMRGAGVPGWMRGALSNDQFELDFYDLTKTGQNTNRGIIKGFWTFIANRYKANPYVLFNFFNEPFFSNSLVTKSNADAISKNYVTFIQVLFDAVRTNATNLIVVDHPATYFCTSNYIDVAREIIYEVHAYIGENETFANWKVWIDQYVNIYLNGFKRPLFVGEFGFIFQDGLITDEFVEWKEKLSQQVAYLKTLPVCGWQWHDYSWLYTFAARWYNDFYSKSKSKPIFTQEESCFVCDIVFDCRTLTFTGVLSSQESLNEPVSILLEKSDSTIEILLIQTDSMGAYALTKPVLPGAYKITASVPAGKKFNAVTTPTLTKTVLAQRTLTLNVV